jgi:hypothetical protein
LFPEFELLFEFALSDEEGGGRPPAGGAIMGYPFAGANSEPGTIPELPVIWVAIRPEM